MHLSRALALFDYDGCVCLYPTEPDSDIVDIHREALLKPLATALKRYDTVTVGMGSARQSFALDQLNNEANSNGSAIPMLCDVHSFLSQSLPEKTIILEQMLLADIYHHRELGTNFRQIKEGEMPQDDSKYEHYKISIIYAHMHRMASLHKNDAIHVYFFDDRVDILKTLADFFDSYKDFIPEAVVLSLNLYDSSSPENRPEQFFPPISGVGRSDQDFEKTLCYMVKEIANTDKHGDISIPTDSVSIDKWRSFISRRNKQRYNFFNSVGCGDAMQARAFEMGCGR